jgi:hypothetical protein
MFDQDLDVFLVIPSDDNIIHINNYYHNINYCLLKEDIMISLAASHTMRNYHLTEFVKPSMWRLFEAIDRFLEMTHTFFLGLKPKWLSHINRLNKIAM